MSDFEGQGTEEVNTEDTSSVAEDFQPDYGALNESFNEPDTTEDSETPKSNPAWDPILSIVPEPLHAQIIPHLSKTDKHVQELQQKFAPYKGFVDQGISPDIINQSLMLGKAIQENPQAVYDQMREQFGLTHEEAIEQMEDALDSEDEGQGFEGFGDEDDADYTVDIESHPAVVAMREQLEQLQSIQQEQEHTALQNRIAEEVSNEWREIEQVAGGPLSDAVKDDIMQRALHIAGDGLPKLMDGFKAHVQFASQIRNSSANNYAPSVTDGTGMLPTSRTYNMETEEGMTQYIADFAKNLNGGK